jgi:hypothetical protein
MGAIRNVLYVLSTAVGACIDGKERPNKFLSLQPAARVQNFRNCTQERNRVSYPSNGLHNTVKAKLEPALISCNSCWLLLRGKEHAASVS